MIYEVPLSYDGIGKLLQVFSAKSFADRIDEVCKRLCEYGQPLAATIYAQAQTDYPNDVTVTVEKRENGYALVSQGEEVAFLEYGAGVHYNSPDPYPKRPEGIKGIGEYGKGAGKNDSWYYDKGKVTHGNPATLAMWKSAEAMEAIIGKVIEEVFSK